MVRASDGKNLLAALLIGSAAGCTGADDGFGPLENLGPPDLVVGQVVVVGDDAWGSGVAGPGFTIRHWSGARARWEPIELPATARDVRVIGALRGTPMFIGSSPTGTSTLVRLSDGAEVVGELPQLASQDMFCMDGSGGVIVRAPAGVVRMRPTSTDVEVLTTAFTVPDCAELPDGSVLISDHSVGLALIRPDRPDLEVVDPCTSGPPNCTSISFEGVEPDGTVLVTEGGQIVYQWSAALGFVRVLDFADRRIDGPAPEYHTAIVTGLLSVRGTLLATQRTDYGGGVGTLMVHEGNNVWRLLHDDLARTTGLVASTDTHVWLLDGGAGDVWRMPLE